LLLIGLLIPAARTILGDARVGVAAAALTVFNGFHIGMSRTALPYALLPVLLLLALLALLQALRRDRPADWIGAALSLTAAAYVNQIALLFWPMIAACAPAAQARGALRRLIVCIGVAGGAFLLWVAALPRAAFFANSFFQTTAGYEFFAQLAKLAAPYQHMLAPWPVTAAFALGLARLSVETVRHRDDAKAALLVWLALPGAILLTRSMWIQDYHLYSVYPPVVLIAAYGADAAVRTVAVLLPAGARRATSAMRCWQPPSPSCAGRNGALPRPRRPRPPSSSATRGSSPMRPRTSGDTTEARPSSPPLAWRRRTTSSASSTRRTATEPSRTASSWCVGLRHGCSWVTTTFTTADSMHATSSSANTERSSCTRLRSRASPTLSTRLATRCIISPPRIDDREQRGRLITQLGERNPVRNF
jgi:hypothetical protein